jgi:phage FluMu protein Com
MCKFCGTKQKVMTQQDFSKRLMKKCVNCKRRFRIHLNINKTTIIQEI